MNLQSVEVLPKVPVHKCIFHKDRRAEWRVWLSDDFSKLTLVVCNDCLVEGGIYEKWERKCKIGG